MLSIMLAIGLEVMKQQPPPPVFYDTPNGGKYNTWALPDVKKDAGEYIRPIYIPRNHPTPIYLRTL